MEPTLWTNDILLTDSISVRLGHIHTGDIVVARSPDNHTRYVCKRVVALSGDQVQYKHRNFTVSKMHFFKICKRYIIVAQI